MPTSVEAVRNKGVCKTPVHKAIDYRMPTPFPSRREGASRKSDSFDEGTYIDICKGVCKTPLHNIL